MSTINKQNVSSIFDLDSFQKEHKTKSSMIRKLNELGKTRSEIATLLNIRYQHVRNVLITPIKKPKQ